MKQNSVLASRGSRHCTRSICSSRNTRSRFKLHYFLFQGSKHYFHTFTGKGGKRAKKEKKKGKKNKKRKGREEEGVKKI